MPKRKCDSLVSRATCRDVEVVEEGGLHQINIFTSNSQSWDKMKLQGIYSLRAG